MSIVITPIPSTLELAAPAFTLGTTNTAGGAVTAVSSNSTLLTFDATVPTTIAYSATAQTGTAVVSSRRDHNHGMAASDAVGQASTAAIEAETAETTYISPDRAKYSPGIAKAWCDIADPGTLNTPSYNVASITDTGAGDRTVVFTTSFSTTVYVTASTGVNKGGSANPMVVVDTLATGSIRVYCRLPASPFGLEDARSWVGFWGDQA